jgi:phosphoribosylformylglycinamidine synthase subunit PurSL
MTQIGRKKAWLLDDSLPSAWPKNVPAECYFAVTLFGAVVSDDISQNLFPKSLGLKEVESWQDRSIFLRSVKPGVLHPMAQSLAKATGLPMNQIVVDRLIILKSATDNPELPKILNSLWKEPAIEEISRLRFSEWVDRRKQSETLPSRRELSYDQLPSPSEIGLDFTEEETHAIQKEAARLNRSLTRAEWELLAQTWSEHCKHKIFNAEIREADGTSIRSLFKTFLRRPTEEILAKKPDRYLSVFTDNAGVVRLNDENGEKTSWALSMKMETHNSPSAISPYGGASTGIVGVHRDILGTGLGSMPIASWDVLCFETPGNAKSRPPGALDADIIRSGVIRGIQDGGNQSGIPTVQGSIVFSDSYAAKPLVYAGTLGLLADHHVEKKAQPGHVLYCVGGAVGPDGLRGAVMSSRDLRAEDMMGSAVQVAQPFVQRMVTDFLLKARDAGLITSITDNGAGGLASSVGEMAQSTGGASIDLTHVRLKFEGLLAWERLLSESQERMTVATDRPEEFEEMARTYQVDIDRLGQLTKDGHFKVTCFGKELVNLSLEFLHGACPVLRLQTGWNLAQDLAHSALIKTPASSKSDDVFANFETLLRSPHLMSREGVVRRFDHEVQGRSLQLPFQGNTQKSPSDGSQLEIYESSDKKISVALGHGMAPWRRDIFENVYLGIDESLRSALLAGLQLQTAGFLDNFSWPDPLPHSKRPQSERFLWRLVRACEILGIAARSFDIPFISGKDSMKNTQGAFDIDETLVVSVAGSAYSNALVPASFFARANEVIFHLPPLRASLRDSILDRVIGGADPLDRLFTSTQQDALLKEIETDFSILRKRYEAIEKALRSGLLRSAKDIGEGGLLTALFEMCRGRKIGVEMEAREWTRKTLFEEGSGAFVMTCDLHVIRELTEMIPELRRLGVTSSRYAIHLPMLGVADLEVWDKAYDSGNEKGMWS